MVAQAMYRAMRQGFLYWIYGWLTGFLVNDAKNLFHRMTGGFHLRPTGQPFGKGIQECNTPFGIGGHYRITDGVKRNCEFFLANLQSDIGLLQLFIRGFLNLEQMLCFEMNEIL
jgi:hypothetical protein